MRRTLIALAATVAGLFLAMSFKSTPLHAPAGLPQAATAPATPGARSRPGEHSVTGPAVQTPFGPVQVKVGLAGSHITDVQALQLPSDFALSQQISAYARPLLRSETLRAQSSRIDMVSGATYTSTGYQQSLQAALDRIRG